MERIKSIINSVRHDPEALFELRQFVFGLIIAVCVTYGFYYLYVESKEKKQVKLTKTSEQLQQSLGDGSVETLIALELEKNIEKDVSMKERVALLKFKKELFREQYITNNSDHAFSKVIFTLLPRTPVDIENEFVEMSVLETRSLEFYKIHPVNIQGDASFSEFISYLQYIETRPEVGLIDTLKLEQVEPKSFGDDVKIHFDLILGRIQLN